MLKNNKTISFDGASYVIGEDGTEQIVAYFNATIRADDTAQINMSISNAELYEANKAAVRSDYTAFQTEVYEAQDAK